MPLLKDYFTRYGRGALIALAVIACAGFLVRAWVVVNPLADPGDDALAYRALAEALYVDGTFGYGKDSSGGPEFKSPSDWSPGAPLIYAGSYYLTGGVRDGVARGVEALFGTAAILLAFLLTARLLGPPRQRNWRHALPPLVAAGLVAFNSGDRRLVAPGTCQGAVGRSCLVGEAAARMRPALRGREGDFQRRDLAAERAGAQRDADLLRESFEVVNAEGQREAEIHVHRTGGLVEMTGAVLGQGDFTLDLDDVEVDGDRREVQAGVLRHGEETGNISQTIGFWIGGCG